LLQLTQLPFPITSKFFLGTANHQRIHFTHDSLVQKGGKIGLVTKWAGLAVILYSLNARSTKMVATAADDVGLT